MDPLMGTIAAFGFNFSPQGWQTCQGQIMGIAQNTALFALLGTTYGGNGQTTFGLPDLQGRVAVGQGQGPGLSSYVMGQKAGTENTQLTIANMPSHTHVATFTPTGGGGGGGGSAITATLNAVNAAGTQPLPSGNYLAGYNVQTKGIYATTGTLAALAAGSITVTGGGGGGGITGGTVTNALTGSSIPFSTLSPYLCINYCIALQGIFPSRN